MGARGGAVVGNAVGPAAVLRGVGIGSFLGGTMVPRAPAAGSVSTSRSSGGTPFGYRRAVLSSRASSRSAKKGGRAKTSSRWGVSQRAHRSSVKSFGNSPEGRDDRRRSEAIRGDQRSSEAIGGDQRRTRRSEAINDTHGRRGPKMATRSPDRSGTRPLDRAGRARRLACNGSLRPEKDDRTVGSRSLPVRRRGR